MKLLPSFHQHAGEHTTTEFSFITSAHSSFKYSKLQNLCKPNFFFFSPSFLYLTTERRFRLTVCRFTHIKGRELGQMLHFLLWVIIMNTILNPAVCWCRWSHGGTSGMPWIVNDQNNGSLINGPAVAVSLRLPLRVQRGGEANSRPGGDQRTDAPTVWGGRKFLEQSLIHPTAKTLRISEEHLYSSLLQILNSTSGFAYEL